jgi:hypothetical protein
MKGIDRSAVFLHLPLVGVVDARRSLVGGARRYPDRRNGTIDPIVKPGVDQSIHEGQRNAQASFDQRLNHCGAHGRAPCRF